MKKVLKAIGIIVVVLIVAIMILVKWNNNRRLVEKDYETKTEVGGELEEKYLASGPYENIVVREISVAESFDKYVIYYPKNITSEDKLPVLVIANGSGTRIERISASMEHFASWGFVVIGTDEMYSWNGFSVEMCLRAVMKLNEQEAAYGWENNPLYGRLDLENTGVLGHSQGGVGVFNAATDIRHKDMVKTIVAESPTNMELSQALEWDNDVSEIRVPTLLLSGTGNSDNNLIISCEQLQAIYDTISDDVPKAMLRRIGAEHSDTNHKMDGYITAWLLWQLKNDEDAGKAFTGESPEFLNNALYQDGQKNFN